MKIFGYASVLIALASLLGCASIMKDPDESVLFTSTPAGAKVIVNGAHVGQTPVSMNLKAEDYTVVFEREGCAAHSMQLKTTTDGGAVAASVVSGILLVGVFEAVSLADGGSSLYKDLPDVVNIPLSCDALPATAGGADTQQEVTTTIEAAPAGAQP